MAASDNAGYTSQSPRASVTPLEEGQTRRVLLTSNGFTTRKMRKALNKLISLRQKEWSECVFCYIADALVAKGATPERTQEEARRIGKMMGFEEDNCRSVILENESRESISETFSDVDVIFTEFGNTFALKFYLNTSGAIDLIPNLVFNQGVIFVGSSSGSIVAGKSAGVAFWKSWDNPEVAGQEIDWSDPEMVAGLNLIDGKSIFPHYSLRFYHLVETKSAKMDHPVITLTDKQALLFIDNEYRILTD